MLKSRNIIDFSRKLRDWDGFGVNYVEACQTRDYHANPQEYGGFKYLAEAQRQEIIRMIFGEDGLKPGLVKMFQDSFHQPEPGPGYRFDPHVHDPSAYDHAASTQWMRYFVNQGYTLTKARGDDLQIIVALYGPPGWMTKQKFVRGRDLDPQYRTEVAKYMISWAKYLREVEGLPVKYISLHNEGEDWLRWPLDGSTDDALSHDYNMYWPPEQVVDFIRLMPEMLAAHGLADVGVTPGECTGWYRFHSWGYADAIAQDPEAMRNLGLITSHGFYGGEPDSDWFNDWRSTGIDTLREQRPELHAWVTSTSWSKMDVFFVNEIRNSIYAVKVNGIIPWACIQLQGHWVGGDPNPGTAFRVYDDGQYEVTPGYYYYKQVCRAGQPGMAVVPAFSNDRRVGLIAFGRQGTKNPDAFVVLNLSGDDKELEISLIGTHSQQFDAYITSPSTRYAEAGTHQCKDGRISVLAPAYSVTTYFGRDG